MQLLRPLIHFEPLVGAITAPHCPTNCLRGRRHVHILATEHQCVTTTHQITCPGDRITYAQDHSSSGDRHTMHTTAGGIMTACTHSGVRPAVQVILAGSLAFDILDRLTGDWTVVKQDWAKAYIVTPLMSQPGVWFIVSMFLWLVIGYGLISFMHYLQEMAQGVMSLRLKINLPIDMDCFHEFLKRKNVEDEAIECDKTTAIKTIRWTETNSSMWGGCTPVVEVTVDEKYGFLLKAFIQYEKKKGNLREKSIKEVFFDNLRNDRVLKAEVIEMEDMAPLTEAGVS